MTTETLAKETITITPTSTPNFYDVASSNGYDHYAVVLEENGLVTCGCPGFFYKGHCKHADQATAELTFIAPPVEEVVSVQVQEEELVRPIEVAGTLGREVICSNCGAWVMSQSFQKHKSGRYCEVYGGVLPPVLAVAPAPVAVEEEDPTRCVTCGKPGFSMLDYQWYCGPCLDKMLKAQEIPALEVVGPVCVECGLYPPLPGSQVCSNCNDYLYDAYVASRKPTAEEKAQEEAFWHSLDLRDQKASHQEKELEDHLLSEWEALPKAEKDAIEEEEGRGADWQAERAALGKDNDDIFGIF